LGSVVEPAEPAVAVSVVAVVVSAAVVADWAGEVAG